MTTLDPPDRAMRRVLLALAVFFAIIALILLRAAMNPAPAGAESACFRWESTEIAEFSRTVVTQDEVVEIEHQLAKHTRERTKTSRGWSDWSAPVLYEPLSHETWVTEIPEPDWQPHHRSPGLQRDWALLPTGYADTVVVQPEVTETETVWAAEHPGEGWEPTGATDVEIVHVEVPCPDEPPVDEPPVEVPPVEEPPVVHECVDGDGMPYSYEDPTDGDCGAAPEPPVEPTPPAEVEVEVEVVPVAAVEQPRTLPRTGVETWHLLTVGGVLAWLGGSLLGLEAYDRRKRARS